MKRPAIPGVMRCGLCDRAITKLLPNGARLGRGCARRIGVPTASPRRRASPAVPKSPPRPDPRQVDWVDQEA
jgi:hypothetical protein